MNIEGATEIIIRFGDHVQVTWPGYKGRGAGWCVWTGKKGDWTLVMTFPTMDEACDWARSYAAARLPRYRVRVTLARLGVRAGEIGVELPNDFPEKYDHKLKFDGVMDAPGFLGALVTERIFYFHKREVTLV